MTRWSERTGEAAEVLWRTARRQVSRPTETPSLEGFVLAHHAPDRSSIRSKAARSSAQGRWPINSPKVHAMSKRQHSALWSLQCCKQAQNASKDVDAVTLPVLRESPSRQSLQRHLGATCKKKRCRHSAYGWIASVIVTHTGSATDRPRELYDSKSNRRTRSFFLLERIPECFDVRR